MNWLDLAVIGVVGLSAVFAFARGFVREALSIVAWVGAAAITFYGFNRVLAIVDPMVHNVLLSQLTAGFGLFVISLIVLTILTGIVARTVQASGLSAIDRTLGFLFGLARGAFLVCLAYLALDVFVPQTDRPEWLSKARSEPYMLDGANMLRTVLPESWKAKSANAAEELIRTIDPKAAAAAEAQKAMRALANPTATPGPVAAPKPESAPAPNYPAGDRRQLDRVIENQR